MEKIFSSVHILWDSFLVRILQIMVERRNARHSHIKFLGEYSGHVALPPVSIRFVHLKEFVPIKGSIHFKRPICLSTFCSRRDSVYQVCNCQAIRTVSRCHCCFIISLANWICLLWDLSLSTVKAEQVAWCQGRCLKTAGSLTTH